MDCIVMEPSNRSTMADFRGGARYPSSTVEQNNEINRLHTTNYCNPSNHSNHQIYQQTPNMDTLDHCMKAYNHGPCSRMSITFNSSKGLTNAPGQNNCFLNSAVQVLWHLDAFRRSFRLLSGHSCMGNACIFCALKVMFTQFQYSDKSVLPPDSLRQAMAETFANQQRFQMGLMDDAAECFENMLMRIHNHIAPDQDEDTCSAPHCIPHQKFSMSVSEQITCTGCGARSEPFTFNEMVFYVSTGALVTEFKSSQLGVNGEPISFSTLLKNTVSKGDIRACPDNCGKFGVKSRNLMNCPDVVSIGLVWESAKSGSQHIRDVVNLIGTTLNLDELFHSTPSASRRHPDQTTELQLVGVVCYYGKHYSTFFFHSKVQEWFYFDDAAVKQISRNWTKVCEKLCKGRHQPLLLLYMNPYTQAVDVSTALSSIKLAPGYEWKNDATPDIPLPDVKEEQQNHNRSATQQQCYRQHDINHGIPSSPQKPHYTIGRHTERQDSGFHSGNGLSRQDSGVSSHSSRSTLAEPDAVSHLSVLTKHSSDSSSSGVKEMDVALSYSSRASTISSNAGSSMVEGDEAFYTMSTKAHVRRNNSNNDSGLSGLDQPDGKRDKPRISLKKKKMKNSSSRLGADVVRYHSKSQADLSEIANQDVYDDSSLGRNSIDTMEQKSFSYATLPRKKKMGSPVASSPVKGPESNPNDISWMKEVAKKGEMLKQEIEDNASVPSISSRIQMFNNINSTTVPTEPSNKPCKAPEIKQPLQVTKSNALDSDSPSYINRTSVEKILSQQRRASRGPVTQKMVRPTYEEQFVLPEEFAAEKEKKIDLRFDMADNTSVGSLKDSGYRSLGDRGSNSASSVSSASVESPTINNSFTFDTREHIYYEPPPISSEQSKSRDFTPKDSGSTEFDFPPPPTELELYNNGHSKQLSEASLLSDASTLKQRKSPSVESFEDSHSQTREHKYQPRTSSLNEEFKHVSLADSKFEAMLKSVDDNIIKSSEQESRNDFTAALMFCNQAINTLSSVMSQRPEKTEQSRLVHSKQDTYIQRAHYLKCKIDEQNNQQANLSSRPIERRLMGELHIDNQTKRGFASSDYTPLPSAISKAPTSRSHDDYSSRPVASQRILNRTDSQVSNTSNGSSTSTTSTQRENLVEPRRYDYITPSSKPSASSRQPTSIYREVNIPTTLQRHAYIRDGCKTNEKSVQDSEAIPVIPPPREFSESPTPRSSSSSRSTPVMSQPIEIKTRTTQELSSHQYNNHIQQPTAVRPNQPTQPTQHTNNYREMILPPKQNINKQNIRDLLVQDMLKRQGQPDSTATCTSRTYNRSQSSQPTAYTSKQPTLYQSNPQPRSTSTSNYSSVQYEPPLWTPPQQSAYDRGLSHYDSPSYHKRNVYGQVNTTNASDMAAPYNSTTTYHTQQQYNGNRTSMYPSNNQTFQQSNTTRQPHHAHTYSTEL